MGYGFDLDEWVVSGDLTNGVALKRKGDKHVVFYREDATSVELNLAGISGARPARAVDTRKAYKEISLGNLPAKKQTFKAPYKSDWAVAVGAF